MQILNLSSSQQVTSNFELPCGGKVNNFDEKKFNINPHTNFYIYIIFIIYSIH